MKPEEPKTITDTWLIPDQPISYEQASTYRAILDADSDINFDLLRFMGEPMVTEILLRSTTF